MEVTTLLKRSENYVFTEVHDDVVLMDINTGEYASLNETGGQVWKLLEEPSLVSSVLDRLQEIYEGDREIIKAELYEFIQKMQEKGFLETQV